ncbi:sugar porter family MFS transporter [Ningiella sp. W23]|uniref:sugar porter family MFS transporter n=1 Tax=Ningiella sp. W23 TaxID=3023715 RepID=UPI0037581B6F
MLTQRKLFVWSLIAALSGFLFGFDTAVISGAEKAVQLTFQSTDLIHGLAISAALWGTVLGAIFGTAPNDRFGRKTTLIGIGFLYLISALLSAIAWDVSSFAFARFIGGLGVGASTIAAPAYICEISPAKSRGKLVVLYQLSLVVGIFTAYLSNYAIGGVGIAGNLDWRYMLGIEAIPALMFLLLMTRLPESPRWLLQFKQDTKAAYAIFEQIRIDFKSGIGDVQLQIDKNKVGLREMWTSSLRKPIILAFLLGLFNQLSGINAIIYFAPRILEMAGSTYSSALLATVGIGLVNIMFTLIGMALIDRLGRRQLIIIGSLGYIFTLCAIAWNFYVQSHGTTALFIFAFIASHAIGQGAVIWVYIAEIFPTKSRSVGQSVGSSTHWIAAASLALLMPFILTNVEPSIIFLTFALFMILQLIFAFVMMIETKHKSLEQIQSELQ